MAANGASPHPIGAFRVALTGGVGSGKSTVGARLAALGAVVIDADAIAREVVAPGSPGLGAIVERFGPQILLADGSLDRPALAAVVFADAGALADLNAITHPLVAVRSSQLMADVPAGDICVYEVPLLAEGGPLRSREFDQVVVVEAALPIRLDRLAQRGLAPDQARARIAAQATDEQRRAIADEIIVNNGPLADLQAAVDQLWVRLQERRRSDPGAS
jgi:dephospho-CoA kinase